CAELLRLGSIYAHQNADGCQPRLGCVRGGVGWLQEEGGTELAARPALIRRSHAASGSTRKYDARGGKSEGDCIRREPCVLFARRGQSSLFEPGGGKETAVGKPIQ